MRTTRSPVSAGLLALLATGTRASFDASAGVSVLSPPSTRFSPGADSFP